MDLLNIAAKLFLNKLGANGGGLNIESVVGALSNLLPTSGGDLDVGSLVGMFTSNKGLAGLAGSWLSDGGNSSVSASDLMGLFGDNKIASFASSLGLDSGTATNGLTEMLPELIDKSSEGGALVENIAGQLGGKLLGSLF